ncbi:MAG: hypothetical protein R2749_04915 [Acidimicrobiales bacterium]
MLDPPLQVILTIAIPIIAAVYLGVAECARDHAVRLVAGVDDPGVQRQVGCMQQRLRKVASWRSTVRWRWWARTRSRRWRPWPR